MTETKKWYQSKTIIGMMVWAIGFMLPYAWIELWDEVIYEIVTEMMQIFGIAIGIYWRIVADKKVTY